MSVHDKLSDMCAAVCSSSSVYVRGATSKLLPPEGVATRLVLPSGIIDYQPTEFVISAWAGTPIRELQSLLAEHGQYLPFDPLRVEHGATVGGTVALNACGPERYRYGGVRDFLIGVHFIDGMGNRVLGGGNVVKNAAGFDFPKLMVGSRGRFGVITDATFKVFPQPEAYATLRLTCGSLSEALERLPKLTNCAYDLNAVDLVAASGKPIELLVRVGGLERGLAQRIDRVRAFAGAGEVWQGDDEAQIWRSIREMTWCSPDVYVVKVPLTPARIPALDQAVAMYDRWYSVGGTVAWIATRDVSRLDMLLRAQGLSGLVLFTSIDQVRIGALQDNPFESRIRTALDPNSKFDPHTAQLTSET